MPHLLRQLVLLCVLLAQLGLGALTPLLVVCQEAEGAERVELSLDECCPEAPAGRCPAPLEDHLHVGDECGGCDDLGFGQGLYRDEAPVCAACTARLCWPAPLALEPWRGAVARARGPPPATAPPPHAAALQALRAVRLLR